MTDKKSTTPTKTTAQPSKKKALVTVSLPSEQVSPKALKLENAKSQKVSPAVVHDVAGIAILGLPASLRSLVGDDSLVSMASELEAQELLLIVRENGVVAYVHLELFVKELEDPETFAHQGRMILKDITPKTPSNALGASKRRKPGSSTHRKAKSKKPPSRKAGHGA